MAVIRPDARRFVIATANSVRMTEDLEILTPRDCDERHPTRFGDANCKLRRRRYGHENRGAENGRLLHHLDRDAAGEKYNATASVDLPAGE